MREDYTLDCLAWIYDHTRGAEDYCRALMSVGLTLEDLVEEIRGCGFTESENIRLGLMIEQEYNREVEI